MSLSHIPFTVMQVIPLASAIRRGQRIILAALVPFEDGRHGNQNQTKDKKPNHGITLDIGFGARHFTRFT
jgi:hypothetical protein